MFFVGECDLCLSCTRKKRYIQTYVETKRLDILLAISMFRLLPERPLLLPFAKTEFHQTKDDMLEPNYNVT